jgi:diguanylate cyclase
MNEQLVEFGLLEDEPLEIDPYGTFDLASFAAKLLALVSDTTIESDKLKTCVFRSKLGIYRHRLANSVTGDPNTAKVANECFRMCENYLNRAHTYLLDRETEFAEVIDLMSITLGKIAGETNSCNIRLMGSSERLHRLIEIEDIRELRKQIARECELNKKVSEKQRQDEITYLHLSKRIEVLQTHLVRSNEEASLDPLTRVSNRGSFNRAIEQWVTAHRQTGEPFVLAMLDLDDFKKVNDDHGHQVGDRVLLYAAQWFSNYLRRGDFLGRYGGEEFVIMLADSEFTQAEAQFADLISNVAACTYDYSKDGQERTVKFTVSCGLAEFSFDETAEDLLRRADEALYEAKRTGKNRVVVGKKQKSLWTALKPFVSFPDVK